MGPLHTLRRRLPMIESAIEDRDLEFLRDILPRILGVMDGFGHTDTGLDTMLLDQRRSTLKDGLEQEAEIPLPSGPQELCSSEEEDFARLAAIYLNMDAFIVRLRYPDSFAAVSFWPIGLFTVRPNTEKQRRKFSRSVWKRSPATPASKLRRHARKTKSRVENCIKPEGCSEIRLDVLQNFKRQARVPMITYTGIKGVESVLEEAGEPLAEEEYQHEDAEATVSAKEEDDDNHHGFTHNPWARAFTVSLLGSVVTAWLRNFGLRFLIVMSALLRLNCLRS